VDPLRSPIVPDAYMEFVVVLTTLPLTEVTKTSPVIAMEISIGSFTGTSTVSV
jgi:hypothetical protein